MGFVHQREKLPKNLSVPIPVLATVAALTSAVSVVSVTTWDSGGLWDLHLGPWTLGINGRRGQRGCSGFPESLCPVRWSAEWEVLLVRVGAWAEEGTLPRRLGAMGPPCPAVIPLSPFSFKELESQVRCLEKETTELKEAVEQQKVKNNVSQACVHVHGGVAGC